MQVLFTERGYRIRILTRKSSSPDPYVETVVGDLGDPSVCEKALDGVNLVVHAAGEKSDPTKFWSVNFKGTENLLNAVNNKRIRRFVYISSVGVIGADPLQDGLFGESSLCNPPNGYEKSKWEAEKLVLNAGNSMKVAILRPANVFGEHDPRHGLLTLARNIKKGRFIYTGGQNSQCNYVYVEDVAHAILALVEHAAAGGRVYHLSDSCMIGAFVSALADELGVPRPSVQLSGPLSNLLRIVLRVIIKFPTVAQSSAVSRLVSLNNRARFATARLVNELGFKCPVGWRAGLGRIVKWYHEEGKL